MQALRRWVTQTAPSALRRPGTRLQHEGAPRVQHRVQRALQLLRRQVSQAHDRGQGGGQARHALHAQAGHDVQEFQARLAKVLLLNQGAAQWGREGPVRAGAGGWGAGAQRWQRQRPAGRHEPKRSRAACQGGACLVRVGGQVNGQRSMAQRVRPCRQHSRSRAGRCGAGMSRTRGQPPVRSEGRWGCMQRKQLPAGRTKEEICSAFTHSAGAGARGSGAGRGPRAPAAAAPWRRQAAGCC